ncbi:MAG: response regulator transcription factor [Chloroflexi bacterium]|jgi:DNA-binding NarL/FixJ family response regulator|nr:response regulator transcription factor [Chloroflexota bacterium]MBT4074096.1 response regulator transcription factor [Chloroflexota bacterium]MBT4513818.1 response regulator transcription factor [Chloroflexota bacterium]MBT5318617.1 response regulator transcription factor [Chloroflexota bacterium]MBT6681897.1 response regulator transcription factor [Chloroflexota bacterium]
MADLDQSIDANHALRVLVIAQSPVAELGLTAMLEKAGFLVLLGGEQGFSDSVSEIDTTVPDVVVIDARDSSDPEQPDNFPDRPTIFLTDTAPNGEDVTSGERPTAWLRRDARPGDVVAALHAVIAGLNVVDPALGEREVASGDGQDELTSPLTVREVEVLIALADGLTNKAIAFDLKISEHTVKYHVGSILTKLEAASRTEAVSIGARLGLIAL